MPIDDLISEQMNAMQNARDVAFKDIVKYLWDRDYLKSMTKLDNNQVVDVVRNLIVIYIYEKTWGKASVDFAIIADKNPPFYKVTPNYHMEQYTLDEMKENVHYVILHDILELFNSIKGENRARTFDFMSNLDKSLALKEVAQNNVRQQI
jgi:hypothetical protein